MRRRMLLVMLASVVLLGCHQISHGTVTEKETHPEHSSTLLMPLRVGKITMIYPILFHYPESYSVKVKGKGADGRELVETFYVEKEEFDKLNPGDVYTCGEKKECRTDPPKEEVKK